MVATQQKSNGKLLLLDKLIKPLYTVGSVNLNIKRYYTDTSGVLIAKAAAPTALQKKLPVYMLGNFDRVGGFNIGLKTLPPVSTAVFVMTYVFGFENTFQLFQGANTLQEILRKGDIVTVFTDDIQNPSAFAYIVQTVDYGALASIISNTQTQQDDGKMGVINVKNVSYQVDNAEQLNEIWQVIRLDNFGQFEQYPFNPAAVERSPFYKLGDFIELKLSFIMTQYIGLYFNFLYASEYVNVNFRLTK